MAFFAQKGKVLPRQLLSYFVSLFGGRGGWKEKGKGFTVTLGRGPLTATPSSPDLVFPFLVQCYLWYGTITKNWVILDIWPPGPSPHINWVMLQNNIWVLGDPDLEKKIFHISYDFQATPLQPDIGALRQICWNLHIFKHFIFFENTFHFLASPLKSVTCSCWYTEARYRAEPSPDEKTNFCGLTTIIIIFNSQHESNHSEQKTKANKTRSYEAELKRFETLKYRK